VLQIVASDRPGLLYSLARVLATHGISLHSAKINTLGDRAEDVFLISGAGLSDQKIVLRLEQELQQALQV
jgi:[protein-PII] uridylyltransferase